MAPLLGTLLASLLAALGVLHLIWAAGITFPFANEQALARSIIGRRGITRLPSRAAVAFLGVLLFLAAFAALMLGKYAPVPSAYKILLAPVGLVLAGVFLLRGVVGVLPAFERSSPEQPFLSLNRRLYSPLSALIGVGFLTLTFALPNWSWRLFGVPGGG